jgi:hypothetical protein
LGYTWLLGGYPGSEDYARRGILRENCEEIRSTWVLNEPTGMRRLQLGYDDVLGSENAPIAELLPLKNGHGESRVELWSPDQVQDFLGGLCLHK